jgi:pentatricopeptide repeat protein
MIDRIFTHISTNSLAFYVNDNDSSSYKDEALHYLEMMKRLGDDEEIDSNRNGEKGAVGSIEQQKSRGGRGSGDRKTNGRQRKGARQPLRGPDGVAYKLAISACARSQGGHRWQDGIRLLREMKSISASRNDTDCTPDVMAYTTAIAGCSEAGEYAQALSLITEMRKEGIQPNVMTFSAVINACATASAKLARRREEEDASSRVYGNIDITSNYTIAGLENVRMPMDRALKLLATMKSPSSSIKPNIVTYNAAIRACAEGFNLDGAFDLLRQLSEDGLEPTIITYGSLMTACERVGDVEAASKVFRMVKEEEKKSKIKSAGGDSGENGSENQEHPRANEIIYGAAISCCRKAREPERALLLLRKMISEKLELNTVTFNTVIAALSEGRRPESKTSKDDLLWEKALAVYRVMKSKHAPTKISPNRKTYNILIRCLSANLKPGLAESLLIDMREAGFVPDVDLYTMTVRSYERCGNPMKALAMMEYMRKMGYDFYEVKVLDEAFKNGVKVLNRIGRGFSSEGLDGLSYAMSEELIDFNDDGDYQLIDSERDV